MSWLKRKAEAEEALDASVKALEAIAALHGVKIRLEDTARVQREQSAR